MQIFKIMGAQFNTLSFNSRILKEAAKQIILHIIFHISEIKMAKLLN